MTRHWQGTPKDRNHFASAHLWLGSVLFLLIQPVTGLADWRVLLREDESGELTQRVAVVDSPGGERLEVYRDAKQGLYGAFKLGNGLVTLAQAACPTFRVDQRRPVRLGAQGECNVSADQVEFFLGEVNGRQIASPILLQLMNGNTAFFRYQLNRVGYAETAFGLQRSKQALVEVIGTGVKVVWR